jgi:AP-1 complex subunit beta-1
MQKAAIEEQKQLAIENPTAASIAVAGGTPEASGNFENLLDIDFDGAAPASMQNTPAKGTSGLEGLAGTPQRVQSPAAGSSAQPSNTMDDLMGVFGNGSSAPAAGASSGGGLDDLMGGFGGLDLNGSSQSPLPQQQLKGQPKTNDDILGLF